MQTYQSFVNQGYVFSMEKRKAKLQTPQESKPQTQLASIREPVANRSVKKKKKESESRKLESTRINKQKAKISSRLDI